MTKYIITDPTTGEHQCVDDLNGYDGWQSTSFEGDLPEYHDIINGLPVPITSTYQRLKRREVDIYLAGQFTAGFSPSTGPMAGHTLQVRDDTDRTNWLTSQAAYSAAVAQGGGAIAEAEFRTAANDIVTLTYADGVAVLLDMAAWGKDIMRKSWAVKDQIDALTDTAAVQAFDVAAAWTALP